MTEVTPGYDALNRAAGLLDLSARGRIRVTGEDRARLLHALTTNHVQQMKPGDGVYAFFLNAQGRILADAVVLCFDDHFLLDCEPETQQSLREHIDRYIIADDVTLEDVAPETFALGVEGPGANEIAARAGLPAPNHRFSHLRWGEFTVAAVSAAASHGLRVYGPRSREEEVLRTLEGAGAIAATAADAETVRIESFKPRYGCEITEQTLPQETQQTQALHFQKGCYLGQEIVERIRSRGHVNRLLMGFRGRGAQTPAVGEKLLVEGKPCGEVTSATSVNGDAFGLAYVRVPGARTGVLAEINGHPVELFAPLA